MSMSIRLLDPKNTHLIPRISTLKSAAADLRANLPKELILPSGTGYRIPTGVFVKLTPGYCGLLLPRSGLSSPPHFVTISNAPGLIDEDYTGEIFVNLFVLGEGIRIEPGDRIAQIICVRRGRITGTIDHRSDHRGAAGFGSTGVE